jgi:hypothetical protein
LGQSGAACDTGCGRQKPRTTDVSRETVGSAYLPIPASRNSGRRSRLRIASTGRMGQHACLCIALIPDPARKRGPRRVSSPKTTSYCRSSRRFCIGFPPALAIVELSSLLPMRRHREEGGISSRTRGDHVAVPSCGSSVSKPCRAGSDGGAPFVPGPTSCTVCP